MNKKVIRFHKTFNKLKKNKYLLKNYNIIKINKKKIILHIKVFIFFLNYVILTINIINYLD